ncbi:hypothetical protein [Candidatus Hodarchaeum mangrovi]
MFDYRKNIPLFQFITVPEKKYFSHLARREIIKILKKGKQELSPDGTSTRRYALNVAEISKELDKGLIKSSLKNNHILSSRCTTGIRFN